MSKKVVSLISKSNRFIWITLFIAFLLYIFKLSELMMFIGDQGWFYLSARELIVNGEIPLVGITSSHTWINQGPLWTYMLSVALFIGKFNPVAGSFLTILIGLLSIIMIYKLGTEFFNEKFALAVSIFYAFSPLVVVHSRMAYHTSPIPLFVLILMYSLIRWVKGRAVFFPIVLLSMSILYNLELATVIFWPVILTLFIYGYFKKQDFVKNLLNRKILFISALCLIVPMVPVLIYDMQNGFPQTLKFAGWVIYRMLGFIGLFQTTLSEHTYVEVFAFFLDKYSLLVFPQSVIVGLLFFALTIAISTVAFIKQDKLSPLSLIIYVTFSGLIGYFFSKTPSEAYLVMLFPGLIFLLTYSIYFLSKRTSLVMVIVILFSIINIYTLMHNNYYIGNIYGPSLSERLNASKKILQLSEGDKFQLKFVGPGEEFESTTMNYEYILWWTAKIEPEQNSGVTIYLSETQDKVFVNKSIQLK